MNLVKNEIYASIFEHMRTIEANEATIFCRRKNDG